MLLSPIFEVVIGLVVVYYILGSIISFITARILESLETRGKDLKEQLKKIVGEATLKDLVAQPQIKSLAPIRYDGWQGFFTSKIKEMEVEKIPVSNLVDAVFDTFLLVKKQYSATKLKKIISDLPESEAKTNLSKWVEEGVTDIKTLREKTSTWFTGLMDQASAYYKAHARQWVIGLSLGITLLFGVDSIEFAHNLWQDADLRATADAKATFYASQESGTAQIDQLATDLENLTFHIGWWSAPADMPKNGSAGDWALWTVLKILGLGITGAAVSQGSSFWYDILRQLKGEKAASNEEGTDETKSGKEK